MSEVCVLARETRSSAKRTHMLQQLKLLNQPQVFYGGGGVSPPSGRVRNNGLVIRSDSLQSAVINAVIHFYCCHRCAAAGGADVT